jgi:hypothetical protein
MFEGVVTANLLWIHPRQAFFRRASISKEQLAIGRAPVTKVRGWEGELADLGKKMDYYSLLAY